MNDGINPFALGDSMAARMTNVAIRDQLPTTRPGMRVLPMDHPELLDGLNIQGAMIFNPGRGLSQQMFAGDLARIILAAGGRKFEIRVKGTSAGVSKCNITDITGEAVTSASLHLCWLYDAESYAISQDGQKCWIWDTVTAQISDGYNTEDKEASRLANEATVGVYSHGRICQVVDGRKILIGDVIHKNNLTNPVNIRGMTEQVYWATGSFQSPPSNIGGIMAAGILARKNTVHGHAETMFHSPDGVFSVDLNIYPREKWTEQQLTNHALLGTGACGPYCLAIDDGDQIFRSKHGIQTLRSAAAEDRELGNPVRPISWPVHSWTKADHQPFLRFCSLNKWEVGARIVCTTGMQVQGALWYSNGILVQNLNPVGASNEPAAWEGLWTTMPQVPHPVLLLCGDISDVNRFLILCYDKDNKIVLAEVDESLDYDQDQCGNRTEISSQLITAELASGDAFSTKEYEMGSLILRKARRTVELGVWCRCGHDDPWTPWYGATIEVRSENGKELPALRRPRDKSVRIGLGEIPKLEDPTRIQLLIRWKGFAQLEGVKLVSAKASADEGRRSSDAKITPRTELDSGDYNDYEYPQGSTWITK